MYDNLFNKLNGATQQLLVYVMEYNFSMSSFTEVDSRSDTSTN